MQDIIVDNFAGGGGASSGIEAALGRPIDYAINHDPRAIAMHRANHPRTVHLISNVWDVNPRKLAAGRPVALGWFSPDCLVMVRGEPHRIVDIGMRMLTPRELYLAQGFRPDYIIDHGIDEDGGVIPLTKTAQVHMCGNSVSPVCAEALVRANLIQRPMRWAA